MQTLQNPPKMNMFLLIILGFVTLGVFFPIWFLIRKDWLNSLSSTKKLGSGLAIFVLITWGFSVIMIFVPLDPQSYETWELIDNLITLVGWICLLILAFQARGILIQHYDENLGMNIGFSGGATFFFQEWCLQYKINRLPLSSEALADVSLSKQSNHKQVPREES